MIGEGGVGVNVVKVSIDPDSRYIVVIKGMDKGSDLNDKLVEIHTNFLKWWESGDKFFLFAIGEGIELEFERVGERR